MSSAFSIDDLDANAITRLCKQNLMLEIMKMKTKNPKLTRKQIAEDLVFFWFN